MDRGRLFAWGAVLATAGALMWAGAALDDLPPVSTLLFWIVLLIAVELLPVTLAFGSQVTMAFPIHLALAILFDPAVAMIIAGLGSFDPRELRREIAPHHAFFNRCQTMLSVGVASLLLSPHRPNLEQLDLGLSSLVAIGFAALLYTAVNLSFVAFHIHFRDGLLLSRAYGSLLPQPMLGFWISYLLLAGLGAATAIVYERVPFGAFAVAAFVIPLLFARLSILGARAQQELSERLRKQQQALLKATEKVFEEREQERKRIAEGIHDSSLQLLAAASYASGNALQLLDAGDHEPAKEAIRSGQSALEEAMKALRESLVDLRRSSIEEGGLMETIHKFVDQVSTLWDAEVRVEGTVTQEPPIPVALAAFQILQEGLINALKHADSNQITVRVNEDDAMVHIVVEDDGRGFDPAKRAGDEHVGMQLMRDRAEQLGGRLEMDSEVGRGTRLEVVLPAGVSQA